MDNKRSWLGDGEWGHPRTADRIIIPSLLIAVSSQVEESEVESRIQVRCTVKTGQLGGRGSGLKGRKRCKAARI
jgi:hypothetical protein